MVIRELESKIYDLKLINKLIREDLGECGSDYTELCDKYSKLKNGRAEPVDFIVSNKL